MFSYMHGGKKYECVMWPVAFLSCVLWCVFWEDAEIHDILEGSNVGFLKIKIREEIRDKRGEGRDKKTRRQESKLNERR